MLPLYDFGNWKKESRQTYHRDLKKEARYQQKTLTNDELEDFLRTKV